MDELEHDQRQMSLTDKVLEQKFAPVAPPVSAEANMTPMQVRMAKARATKARNLEAKKLLTENTPPVKIGGVDEAKVYTDALLTFIQLRNPKSQAEFDLVKMLADDVVKHISAKYA